LFIYATMNTSDQSLFPMDAAFKRRWDWRTVPVMSGSEQLKDVLVDQPGNDELLRWVDLISALNDRIVMRMAEDKRIAPWILPSRFDSSTRGGMARPSRHLADQRSHTRRSAQGLRRGV